MASLWEGRLIDEIERLRNRLELYATNEDGSRRILLDDTSDGIACRDETIREQDETIDRLRRKLAEARDWQRRAREELVEARDDVVECQNRTHKPHSIAYYKDRLKAIDVLIKEAQK